MQNDSRLKGNFLNRREWGSYVSALHGTATYPKVVHAVRSGCDWFTQGATQASNWLAGAVESPDQLKYGQT